MREAHTTKFGHNRPCFPWPANFAEGFWRIASTISKAERSRGLQASIFILHRSGRLKAPLPRRQTTSLARKTACAGPSLTCQGMLTFCAPTVRRPPDFAQHIGRVRQTRPNPHCAREPPSNGWAPSLTSPRTHTLLRPAVRRDISPGTAGSAGLACAHHPRPSPTARRCIVGRPPKTTPARR
jgi:hypothetical protein